MLLKHIALARPTAFTPARLVGGGVVTVDGEKLWESYKS